jgi:hypothetical protein
MTSTFDVVGAEAATILSSLFMTVHWSFRRTEAIEVMRDARRGQFRGARSEAESSCKRPMERSGRAAPRRWRMVEGVCRRTSARDDDVRDGDEDWRLLSIAMAACQLEFAETKGGWVDFCIASPGAIDDYGVGPPQFAELLERVRARG